MRLSGRGKAQPFVAILGVVSLLCLGAIVVIHVRTSVEPSEGKGISPLQLVGSWKKLSNADLETGITFQMDGRAIIWTGGGQDRGVEKSARWELHRDGLLVITRDDGSEESVNVRFETADLLLLEFAGKRKWYRRLPD